MRKILIEAYLDYVNNYLTIQMYADRNALTLEQATCLIELGRQVFNSPHPDE